ncbi:hypothetical protein [Maritalea sp.]|uniref:hypothetical protein n=1 Tax=Maritalea sp. TaxID=2003361 RepID=UPI003EF72151
MTAKSFAAGVNAQIKLLNAGEPLEALDQFFASDGVMYANDQLFAKDGPEARSKQERYILAAKSIDGAIEDLAIDEGKEICVFRNLTSFVSGDGERHTINGLCWQQWADGKIVEERYFDGETMASMIAKGILQSPDILSPLS